MFKRLLPYCLLLLITVLYLSATDSPSYKDCSLRGKKLFGNVKVVTAGATFKVKVVGCRGQLKVRKVTYRPANCGEWRFVTANEDFTIQFVTAGEDFTIEYVNFNPGVRQF